MTDLFIAILSTIGALAILFASIGILRMPDFYLRLSVTVKAGTLGVGLLLACAAFTFQEESITIKAVSIAFFLILTAPVAAHMMGRTAFHTRVPIWKGTIIDKFEQVQDKKPESFQINPVPSGSTEIKNDPDTEIKS